MLVKLKTNIGTNGKYQGWIIVYQHWKTKLSHQHWNLYISYQYWHGQVPTLVQV